MGHQACILLGFGVTKGQSERQVAMAPPTTVTSRCAPVATGTGALHTLAYILMSHIRLLFLK